MRINREIRVSQVRLIDKDGKQVGVVAFLDALNLAHGDQLDLVEISPKAEPPVCKIIDYGKYCYQLTKRERGSKKLQQQAKLKEIKLKPNIDEHDFQVKLRRAREFIQKGNKVKVTCTFRGREMAHTEVGERLIKRFLEGLREDAITESSPRLTGRNLAMVLAPIGKKK